MLKVRQIENKTQEQRHSVFSSFGKRILAEGLALVVSVSIITGCATSLKNFSSLNNPYNMTNPKNNPKPIPISDWLKETYLHGKFDVESYAVAPNRTTIYFGWNGKKEFEFLIIDEEGYCQIYSVKRRPKTLELKWDPKINKFAHIYEFEGKVYEAHIPADAKNVIPEFK